MSTRPQSGSGSLVQQVMLAVRAHIRENGLKVGDTLPGEGQFAAELRVSRAVMREAFGALAALKLIDVGNGRRARVSAMDGSVIAASLDHAVATSQISVSDIWDVRRTVEQRMAGLAADRRNEGQARQIAALAEAMAHSADDLALMTRYDIAFHEAIANASGNALFLQIVQSFEPLMEAAVHQAWRTRTAQAQRDAMIDRHRILAQAIVDRDVDAATAAMRNHFDGSIGAQLTNSSSFPEE